MLQPYVLGDAITGTVPSFNVNYSLALLSKGNLSTPFIGKVDLGVANQVAFGWDDNSVDVNLWFSLIMHQKKNQFTF
jgi:hypothetical protein